MDNKITSNFITENNKKLFSTAMSNFKQVFDITNINSATDAKVAINSAVKANDLNTEILADLLYNVQSKELYKDVQYTNDKGEKKHCKGVMDFVKTIDGYSLAKAQTYNLVTYGEMRKWVIYRHDENGNEILGIIERDENKQPILVDDDIKLTDCKTVCLDKDKKPLKAKQFKFKPATTKTIITDGKPSIQTDGEPIVDLYFTTQYRELLKLYGMTKALELAKLGTAWAIVVAHDTGVISHTKNVKELKDAIAKLLNKQVNATVKVNESESESDNASVKVNESESDNAKTLEKPIKYTLNKSEMQLLVAFRANNHCGITKELDELINKLKVLLA